MRKKSKDVLFFVVDDVRDGIHFSIASCKTFFTDFQFSSMSLFWNSWRNGVLKVTMSSFMAGQSALDIRWYLCGFFFVYMGFMLESARIAPSWSEILGIVFVVFTKVGLFVI